MGRHRQSQTLMKEMRNDTANLANHLGFPNKIKDILTVWPILDFTQEIQSYLLTETCIIMFISNLSKYDPTWKQMSIKRVYLQFSVVYPRIQS